MSPEPFTTVTDLTAAGGPIRLYATGEPCHPPVLLLHGAMLDTAQLTWHFLAPALASSHRVYAIDLPRHGGSRPWNGRVDQTRCEQVLEAVLDHLALDQVALVGLSMGAGVALGYAHTRPERVVRAVLCAPGGIAHRRSWQLTTWATTRVPGLLRWTSHLLAKSPQLVRASMVRNLSAAEETPDLDRMLFLSQQEARAKSAHGEPALDDWQVSAFGPFAMRLNYLPQLAELAVPTLWIRGADDPLVGDEDLRRAAEASGGQRQTIADAGHLLTLDQPAQLHHLISEFLHSQRIGG